MTEFVFILDRSGSMHGLEGDTIGGFNRMLEEQQSAEGEALVSTVLFSDRCTVLHDRVPLERVAPMTMAEYRVGGCTALLDAVGEAIHHIGNVHKYARPEDRPDKTMVIITTDGMENASRRYNYEKVKQMIRRQKEKYGWEFIFLGANIDAAAEAGRFGIDERCAVNYNCDRAGTKLTYAAVSAACTAFRADAPMTAEWRAEVDKDFEQRGRG